MTIDFFEEDCQQDPINIALFGLCDDEDGSKAYASTTNPASWIATVKNMKQLNVVFTAVDKCVIKDGQLKGVARCDGILHSSEHLYFVELKDQQANWLSGALAQLESTVTLFAENHNLNDFKFKKAFACNKQHGRFKMIDNEQNLKFFRKYGVRLDSQTDIIIL